MSGRDEETNWKPLSEVKPPLPRLLIPRPRPPPVGHSRAQWPDRPHLKHSLLLMAAVRSSAWQGPAAAETQVQTGREPREAAAVYFQGPCLRHTRVCTRPRTRRCARLADASPTRPISLRRSAVQSEPPARRAAAPDAALGAGLSPGSRGPSRRALRPAFPLPGWARPCGGGRSSGSTTLLAAAVAAARGARSGFLCFWGPEASSRGRAQRRQSRAPLPGLLGWGEPGCRSRPGERARGRHRRPNTPCHVTRDGPCGRRATAPGVSSSLQAFRFSPRDAVNVAYTRCHGEIKLNCSM